MDSTTLSFDFFVLTVSLLFSAFFSSAETSLTALPESRIRQLTERDPKRWGPLQLWLKRPNRVLTTILIGNNIVNIFLSMYAGLVTNKIFGQNFLSFAVIATTMAVLLFGEISPKTFAKHNAEKIAPFVIRCIHLIYFPLFPVVWFFTSLSKGLVSVFGGRVSRSGPFVTEEDITFMLKLGESAGVFHPQEQELITSIFEFRDTIVREIMVPRTEVEAIPLHSSLDEVIECVMRAGHTRLPVYDGSLDDIRGFFHARELIDLIAKRPENFLLEDHLYEAFCAPELMKITQLLIEFQQRKVHICVVVDEYGGTSGIVSLEDILEEIVGEIQDEYDDDRDEIRKLAEDHFIADGKADLDEIAELTGIIFPEDKSYETLGGFLTSSYGRLPKQGYRLQYEGWLFIVIEAASRRVARVEIEKMATSASARKLNVLTSPSDVIESEPRR